MKVTEWKNGGHNPCLISRYNIHASVRRIWETWGPLVYSESGGCLSHKVAKKPLQRREINCLTYFLNGCLIFQVIVGSVLGAAKLPTQICCCVRPVSVYSGVHSFVHVSKSMRIAYMNGPAYSNVHNFKYVYEKKQNKKRDYLLFKSRTVLHTVWITDLCVWMQDILPFI